MAFFKRLIDFFTLGSDRPLRRLVAYYTVLVGISVALLYFFPVVDQLFSGERLESLTTAPQLLQDGLATDTFRPRAAELPPRVEFAITTTLMLIGTLFLMLPVSWVFMSVRRQRQFDQSVVQTLIILPIVVAGIVLIVRNSLALAFSLAGIVAGVRFRTTLDDVRDAVYVFLAIGVGLAAGVQAMTVAFLLSAVFNFVVLLSWHYDFGRNVLEPAPSVQWAEPLSDLAGSNGDGKKVPDRDLVLALTPKQVDALAKRFNRVRQVVVQHGKKPRFNAILSVTTNALTDAQQGVERVLGAVAKRWMLDEVVTNEGKPSELYYLIRLRKSTTRDEVLTAVRTNLGDRIEAADIEIGDAMSREKKAAS